MKKANRVGVVFLLAAAAGMPLNVAAQAGGTFKIEKSVIAGGGGRASGGAFVLDGTVGQSIAGVTSSGGTFQVAGGFWATTGTGPVAGSLAGVITYGTAPTGPRFVPGVLLAAAGSTPLNASTDASGAYAFNGFGPGSYTITPTKTGDVNGSISGLDAARVAQHVAGLITLTPNQQLAGDATNNGGLSGLDAARIAQFAAGLTNPGIAGQWKFIPTSRNYASVANAITGENYEAILVGDVTGNWQPAPPRPADQEKGHDDAAERPVLDADRGGLKVTKSEPVEVRLLSEIAATPGQELIVPIRIGDTTGKGIVAYDFTLVFDPHVLKLADNPFDSLGTLSNGWSVIPNPNTPSELRVTAYSTAALSGSGALLNIRFNALPDIGGFTQVKVTRMELNENLVPVALSGR